MGGGLQRSGLEGIPAEAARKDGFLPPLAILQMHSAQHEFLQTSCCKHSKVMELSPWEISNTKSAMVS